MHAQRHLCALAPCGMVVPIPAPATARAEGATSLLHGEVRGCGVLAGLAANVLGHQGGGLGQARRGGALPERPLVAGHAVHVPLEAPLGAEVLGDGHGPPEGAVVPGRQAALPVASPEVKAPGLEVDGLQGALAPLGPGGQVGPGDLVVPVHVVAGRGGVAADLVLAPDPDVAVAVPELAAQPAVRGRAVALHAGVGGGVGVAPEPRGGLALLGRPVGLDVLDADALVLGVRGQAVLGAAGRGREGVALLEPRGARQGAAAQRHGGRRRLPHRLAGDYAGAA
mmetsp:Transcript_115297/g.337081  ORF Transcript_115297/g.337081 Transcript_115297/m.337081 type:complete len:282 (+) Transcript_115297:360-1205(+)